MKTTSTKKHIFSKPLKKILKAKWLICYWSRCFCIIGHLVHSFTHSCSMIVHINHINQQLLCLFLSFLIQNWHRALNTFLCGGTLWINAKIFLGHGKAIKKGACVWLGWAFDDQDKFMEVKIMRGSSRSQHQICFSINSMSYSPLVSAMVEST